MTEDEPKKKAGDAAPAPPGEGPGPTVAFQGEPGAYSEEAVRAAFGEGVEPVPRRSFENVARSVVSGQTDRGLLPVENTLAGTVAGSYDVLAEGDLEVVGEVVRPIRHCLLGIAGAGVGGLERVLSHPVALAQCTNFFRRHPEIEGVAVYDTAGAARTVAEDGNPSVGAIAAEGAARRYGLEVLETDLQDRADNQTRFYVVRRRRSEDQEGPGPVIPGPIDSPGPAESGGPAPSKGEAGPAWKTALLFRTRNEPGALVRVLQAFSSRAVNLSKLESRPGEDPWTYRFFLEFEERGDRGPAREALREAADEASELKVLGIFPRWPETLVDGEEATPQARRDR